MATIVEPTSKAGPTASLTPADVADAVRAAYSADEPLLPVGGGTALDFGGVSSSAGRRLEVSGLNRIVDYTPRDMTIVVEAGVRMADLAVTLASEGQQLPIDVPRAAEATIGGVVATNWCGLRRYGHGTIRDYVIGIRAVDGRGVAFKGGGRVVKNVAGYDFCKLLTGSLGTLAVIMEVVLKVKPQAECCATIVAECADLGIAEATLGRLAMLEAPPVAIDLLVGDGWRGAAEASPSARPLLSDGDPGTANRLAVRLEGTGIEVDWLAERVQSELAAAGAHRAIRLGNGDAVSLWNRQVEFADRGTGDETDNSPLTLQIIVPPSAVTKTIAQLVAFDADCLIQAHAASGVIVARFAKFRQGDLTSTLIGKLRPAATRLGGSAVVVRTSLEGLTPHLAWGGRSETTVLLEGIKQKFDPKGILNPGRFVF
ncbi:MAG: FAD-binding oxidoreductase [Pirellulales bacterium]